MNGQNNFDEEMPMCEENVKSENEFTIREEKSSINELEVRVEASDRTYLTDIESIDKDFDFDNNNEEETLSEESEAEKIGEDTKYRKYKKRFDFMLKKNKASFMTLNHYDSDSMYDVRGESVTPLDQKLNELLKFLQDLPVIENLSETSLPSLKAEKIEKSAGAEDDLKETDRDSFSIPNDYNEEVVEEEEMTEVDSLEETQEEESAWGFDNDSEDLVEVVKQEEQEQDINEYFKYFRATDATIQTFDLEELELKDEQRKVVLETRDFLSALINRVVDFCTYEDQITMLRENLDKHKLIEELQMLLQQLFTEQRVNTFVHYKVVDHHRRKHQFHSITETNIEHVSNDIQKYKELTQHLNMLLGEEVQLHNISEKKKQKLEDTKRFLTTEVKDATIYFENLVKKNFCREKSKRLKVVCMISASPKLQ